MHAESMEDDSGAQPNEVQTPYGEVLPYVLFVLEVTEASLTYAQSWLRNVQLVQDAAQNMQRVRRALLHKMWT